MLETGINTEVEIGTKKGRRHNPFSQSSKHSNWRMLEQYVGTTYCCKSQQYDSAKHDRLMECHGGALHS